MQSERRCDDEDGEQAGRDPPVPAIPDEAMAHPVVVARRVVLGQVVERLLDRGRRDDEAPGFVGQHGLLPVMPWRELASITKPSVPDVVGHPAPAGLGGRAAILVFCRRRCTRQKDPARPDGVVEAEGADAEVVLRRSVGADAELAPALFEGPMERLTREGVRRELGAVDCRPPQSVPGDPTEVRPTGQHGLDPQSLGDDVGVRLLHDDVFPEGHDDELMELLDEVVVEVQGDGDFDGNCGGAFLGRGAMAGSAASSASIWRWICSRRPGVVAGGKASPGRGPAQWQSRPGPTRPGDAAATPPPT